MYAEFVAKRAEYTYKCRFNGEVIYLETALNDRFDPVNRAIYITDAVYDKVYIYKKSELKPAIIAYRKWNAATSFAAGKFCFYNGLIYSANATALNKVPGIDPEWDLEPTKDAPILRKKANYNGGISFWVMVPVALVFSTEEMTALVNYYKLAGRGFEIKTF